MNKKVFDQTWQGGKVFFKLAPAEVSTTRHLAHSCGLLLDSVKFVNKAEVVLVLSCSHKSECAKKTLNGQKIWQMDIHKLYLTLVSTTSFGDFVKL